MTAVSVSNLTRHRGMISTIVVLTLAVAALVAYAISASGYTARHVDLNDGGIWVTNNAQGLFGRLNKPIGQLDAGFFPPGGAQASYSVDVVQNGSTVLAFDRGQGRLFPVDVRTGAAVPGQTASVPGNDKVELAGDTAAVLDPSSGRLWAARLASGNTAALANLDTAAKPLTTVGANSDVAVTADGTIYAASAATQKLVTVRPSGAGFGRPAASPLHRQMAGLAISAVGDTPVILDAKGGAVLLPGGPTTPLPQGLAGSDAVLQQPGPRAAAVVLADSATLLSVPLNGAAPTALYSAGSGLPARPVVLGGCVHAAWAGTPGEYARSCDGKAADAQKLPRQAKVSQPVFRVNRGALVLNDLASGGVWIVDSAVQKVDDWQAIRPPEPKPNSSKPNDPTHKKQPCALDRPPQPKPDTLGVRPGRTTVLHLLENDTEPCPDTPLAISAATEVDNSAATASVAADGQTVELAVPSGATSDIRFKYTVSDGRGHSASAAVTAKLRAGDLNEPPAPWAGYEKSKVWTVAAGGTFTYPVLSDWRDFDGDPLAVTTAGVAQGTVAATSDGSVIFTAPGQAGVQTIRYQVSDGIGDPVPGTLKVRVLAQSATDAVPATAEPDVVRAVVGHPMTISPLANDVPGSDPTDPSAKLTLAAPLPQPIGATVTTDLAGGTVTVTAKHAGTLALKYQAAFGSAKLASGVIRVDAVVNPSRALPPVAMPDTAVLHAQQPGTVDVLANDYDPSGGVLVVQRAVASDEDGLEIAVVGGHWLRVWSTQPVRPGVRLIHYTVTDGMSAPVIGQVSVLQLPAAQTNTPPTPVDDLAVVRAVDEIDVPVLDNDIDADGDPLTLKPGRLLTTPGIGAAYASGSVVRYAAPASVPTATQVVVDYVVSDPSGATSVGHARITVNPLPADRDHDQPPTPSPVTRAVVAGDQITITVPWTGVDPDGDSVTVTGLASAPQLGRLVAIGPTTITYQAYPLAAGTDTFSYQVSDRFGLSGTATMRIGVVPPGDPQPPVAVDDHITAAAGSTVRVPVLANDLTAPGDSVSIEPLSTTNDVVPPGTSVQGDRVVVKAPPATGRPLIVSYGITDGTGGHSVAQVIIDSLPKYDMPPTARDDVAKVSAGATSSTVDVLANDDDPDGPPDALSISRVFAPSASVVDRKLVVAVQAFPQTVGYEVRDHGGATSMALVHVPGNGSAQPHVRPDISPIQLAPGATTTIRVGDYVVDPANKPVRLTTTDRIWASPDNGLRAASDGPTSLQLTAGKDYQGPAAAIFEVTDGTSLSDPKGLTAILALPVQIGSPQPVLRCPSDALTAVQGGSPLKIDIATLCHVWVDDPSKIGQVDFTTTWAEQVPGVSLTKTGNSGLTITPGAQSRPGTAGTLRVSVAGTSVSATLNLRVIKAPPAAVAPITVRGLKAGDRETVDLRSYVQSPIQGAKITVLGVRQLSGTPIGATPSGSRITLSVPSGQTHGTMAFDLTVTDVPGHPDREVPGRLTVEVLGLPGQPGRPSVQSVTSHTVVMVFTAPANNGAPLDQIELTDNHGGTHSCPASPCTVGALTNGQDYQFTVRAHNVVGWGPSSLRSANARPDQVPDPVGGVAAVAKDRSAAVTWAPGHVDGSAITSYQVQTSPAPSSGQSISTVQGTATTISGLTNGITYSIRVRAINAQGAGAFGSSAQVIPFGTPAAMAAPTAQGADSTDNSEKAITVSWAPADGNGRAISKYTVTEYKNGATADTRAVTGLSAIFSGLVNDGSKYTYSVTATNAGNLTSPPSPLSAPVTAAAQPAPPGTPQATATGQTGTLQIQFTLGQPHAARIDHVNYQVSNGMSGTWSVSGTPGTTITQNVTGLADGTDQNGPSYTVTISECNEQPSVPCSSTVTSNSAHPWGPPNPPTSANGSVSGQTITWSWSGGDGNGRAWHYETSVDGQGWVNRGTGTSFSASYGWSTSHTLRVRVVNDQGTATGAISTSASIGPMPWSFTLSQGAHHNAPDCTSSQCAYFHFQVTGFAPNTTYTVTFTSTQGHANSLTASFKTDGSGAFNGDDTGQAYFGYSGDVVTAHAGGHDSNAYTWP